MLRERFLLRVMTLTDRILTLRLGGKEGVNMDCTKYYITRDAILAVLRRIEEISS